MKRFFIIGNPRSGTTLFRLMLNKHSSISVPPEAGFLIWLYEKYSNITNNTDYTNFINDLKETKKIESWNINYNELNDFLQNSEISSYTELIDKVYEFYTLHVINKQVKLYGDKNNYYLNHIDLLATMYPNAKFIHIIRDGRSIAVSYKELMQKDMKSKYSPNLPTKIKDIATEWTTNISTIEKSFEKLATDNILTIRYEDLVLTPEITLIKVCTFLDIEFEEQMLEYYKTQEREGLEPKEYMEWKSKNLKPIISSEAYKLDKLSDDEKDEFNSLAQEILTRYDYC